MENDFLKPLNDYLKSYKTEQENGEIFRVRRDENGKIIDKVRAYGNNNRPLDLLPAEEKPVSIWDVKRKIPFTTALADPDEAEYGLLTQTLEVPKERFFGLKKLDVKTGDIINSGMAEVFKFPSVKLLAGPKEVKETALNGEAQRTAAAIKAGANWSMNALKNVFEGLVTIGDSAIEAFAKPAPEDYEFMPEKAKAVWENGLKLDAEKRNKETAFALKQFEDFAQSVIEKTGTNLNAGARPDEALVYEGTQAAMSLLGAIGVTVLAKNPSAGAAFFGAMQLGDTTSEGLKAGLSYQKAKAAGFTDAAWISATELIGLKTYLSAIKANNLIANAAGRIMAKAPKNLPARFAAVTAAGAFTEGAQEYIQDTGTDLIKNAYGVQNEKLGDILQKNIMSFVWGAVMGGGFGAAFNGARVLGTANNISKDLQKAGLNEEEAWSLAEQTAGEILSEDFVRDLTGPLIKEMSPMTYPDFDKNKVSQNLEAAIAEQKDRTKQLIDISAGYEEALRKNGAKEEEAQAAGRILANIVDNIAKKNKVLPKTAESFLNFKIERQAEDLPPAAQESYAQAAAMYKTPHKDFEDFYNAAQNNKGKKQSYYTFTTQGGTNIDIPSDSLLHDKKHPEMNPEEWKRVLTNIDNIEEGLALKSKQGSKYKGIPLLLKVKGKDATYGVALELLDNGRILLTTAFKGTGKKGVDAWLKQVKNAGTPDTLVFDFRLTTDNSRRATTSGHSSFYSLSDIAEAVKAEDLPPAAQESYAQAAMYRKKTDSLAEFKNFALKEENNPEEHNKSFYRFYNEQGIAIDVPFERALHYAKEHDLTEEQLQIVEKGLNKFDYAYMLPGYGEYNGSQIKFKTDTSLGKMGGVFEILPSGRIFLDTVFFDSDANIDNWAEKNPSNAPGRKPVFIGRGINSLKEITDFVKAEDLPAAAQESYGQAAAMYKSRANSLAEFKQYAETSKKRNKQYYVINGEEDITVPQERIISGDNKKISPEDLELIENSLKHPDIQNYEILQGSGAYNGIRVVLSIKTAKGDLNTLMEIAASGKIFLEKAKLNAPIKKLAGMRTLKASAVSPGLINSLSDIVDIVNSEFEKNIEQKPASEIINITNGFKERINDRESRTYNKNNFYRKTTGDFKTASAPNRAPDFVSASSSKYWYEDYGVFRQSDHWGKVSSNEWTLDGKESTGEAKTGYAKWEDFAYNGAKDKARLAKYENALNKKLSEAEDLPPAAQESYAQNGVEEINKNKTVDLTPAFKHIQNLTKENALQIVEEELNALIGKPLDTATPPLQIQITSENKYHIISSNVQLKGNQKKRHQSSLLVLEKIINNAVKTQRKGEVDLRHNTRPQTLRHKSNVEEYIYFSAPLKISTDKGEVYFTAELASERVKGQSPDLLDLYNIRIKRAPAAAFNNTLQTEGSKNESQPINTSDVNSITNEAEDFNSYTPQDEKRAAEFVRPQELQSPKGNKADGFFNNIPTKEDVVKRYGQGKRGSIDLSKKENVYYALVKIMQTGDKSTLLHELGHLWLYTAQDIYAEDEFKETKKDLDEWLGKPQVKDGRYVYTRAQQEKLAQGLETYLMEGKPPAPALKSVFEKIRQWFMDIYNGALVEMSEAGRAVYDRMFELSGRDVEEHLKLYQDEVKTKKTRKAIKQLREEGRTDVEGLTLQDIEEYLSVLDMGAPPLPKATLRAYLRKYGANYAGAGRVDAEAYKNARIPNRKDGIGDDLARRLIDWGFLDGDINTYEDLNRLNQEAAEMIERALNGEDVYRLEDLPAVEQFEAYMEAAKTAEDALGGKIEEYRRVKEIIKGLRLEGYRPVSAKDIDFVAAQIEELEASAREETEEALNPKIEKARKEAEAWKNTADKRQEDLHKAKAAARAEFEEKLKAFTESEMPDAENYKNPSKDCVLPPLNTADLKLLNKKSKPVVLKKNIIEKEKKRHPEIPTEEYNEILAKALYGATAILQVKPKTKPNYFTFLREDEKGQSAVLEMAENKDNFEVVSFLKIDRPRAELYKKNTRREGGEFLITERSEPQGAAHLSALASDNKSITEKERKVNQRVRAVKKAVISEINKREIENKEALLKELKEAKEAKDILDAAGILLEKLEAEYAKTEEGKAERRKLDAPATDWGAKKAGVLKEINALMQSAEEKTRQAQAVLEEESRAKLGYRGPLTEEEKSAANRAKAFLKENFTPRLTAVLQKALSGEEHLSPADVNRMIAHTAGTVSHFKKSLNQQINGLMAWAEKTQKENYNRYIWRKIDTELKRKAFEKSGNVKKAKLSQRAFDFLQKAREYWGLKAPEFTLENFKKPLRAEDITEIHNQVTGEAIPLIDHVKGRETEKVKPIEISQHRSWTNTKEDEKILSNIVFKDGKALVLKSKNGKKYALSKGSLGKMYSTAYGRDKGTFEEKRNIIADIENVFPQMELVISHKEAKSNIDRNIERFAAVVKDKNGNLFNVMAVAKNGKVAEVLINNLYDLQIEGKKVAEGLSGAYSGHLPHIDNLGDLRDFVKRKIAKYNKNYAGQKVIPARDTAFKPLLNGDNDIIAEKSNTFNTRTKPYSPEELQVILNARQDKAMAAVQNGDIYPVEEALLNGVLEFLVNGKENNPADSQKLFEDVSALLKAGRANKLRENLRKQLSREYLREALNQALRNRKLPFGAKWFLNLPDTNYKQFLLNAFGVIEHEEVNEYGELVKTKTNLADALDTLQGQRGTALYKYEKGQQLNDIFRNVLNIKSNGAVLNKIAELQKTVFTAENYMRALNEADGAEQARILQDGKWLAEQDIDQDDLNKLEIMSVYEWYKNTQPETREDGSIVDYGLRGRLLRQYGQNQLDQMFNLLTPAEKRLADVLQQFTAAQWARENAVFREMHGFSLPQDPNYLPSVARRMDIGGDTDYIKQYISASANPSFIKKRVKSFRVAMKPTSILEIVQNHTNRAAEYINEALTFNLIKGVFKSEKIERAFESAAGREDGKKLYDKLLRLIDLQGPQIKKSAGSSPFMEFIFNGWVKSAMALKATVGAKQFATGISFAEKMPFHIWAKYFLEGMAKPKATYDFMLKNVPHIEVRFAQGSINESLQRAMAARDLNLLQTRWNNFTNALMFNIRWGDKASFVYGGYPYYKYLTEDLKLSPREARAKVEEQGESTLQSSQKALLGEYQANADNYAARIYTVFRNQSKQYFGKLATSYIQYKNGEISAADFGKTWLLYAALNPMIYTLLGFAWLYPGKDDDGEEKAQKGLFDVLASPFTGLASVNAFAEAGVKYLLDAVYAKSKNKKLPAPSSVAMPAFEDIQRDVNKAVKAYNDAGGLEDLLGEMSLTDTINSLAALLKYTGLPAQTALNAAGGVKDVFDGKTAKGLLRAAGYTEYRAGQMTGEKKKKTKKRRKKQRRKNK